MFTMFTILVYCVSMLILLITTKHKVELKLTGTLTFLPGEGARGNIWVSSY